MKEIEIRRKQIEAIIMLHIHIPCPPDGRRTHDTLYDDYGKSTAYSSPKQSGIRVVKRQKGHSATDSMMICRHWAFGLTPLTPDFEPCALCSLELLGAPWVGRRARAAHFHFELRAARPLQPRAARRPLGATRRSLRAARPLQPQAARVNPWKCVGCPRGS